MKRHTFAMKINEGCVGKYRSALGEIWKEFIDFLDVHKMTNFSMWSVENIVFGYFETDDEFVFEEADKQIVIQWYL